MKDTRIVFIAVGGGILLVGAFAAIVKSFDVLVAADSPGAATEAEPVKERVVYIERPKPPLQLAYNWSPGTLFTHDLYVTNTCGEDLSEVRLTFTFVGENGSPSVDRYWASWPLGVKKEVSISVDDVRNVQRITVSGRAQEGQIGVDLTP